jgi:hypothetical protein
MAGNGGVIFDSQTFIHRQASMNFKPLLSVSHVRKIEKTIPGIFKTCELCFKIWRYCMRAGGVVPGAEVKIVAIPLCINIYYVVERLIFTQGLDIFWL